MDALEFLKERKRLCSSYKGCVGCPFGAAESRAAGAAECRNAYREAVYAGHAANVIASARMGI